MGASCTRRGWRHMAPVHARATARGGSASLIGDSAWKAFLCAQSANCDFNRHTMKAPNRPVACARHVFSQRRLLLGRGDVLARKRPRRMAAPNNGRAGRHGPAAREKAAARSAPPAQASSPSRVALPEARRLRRLCAARCKLWYSTPQKQGIAPWKLKGQHWRALKLRQKPLSLIAVNTPIVILT